MQKTAQASDKNISLKDSINKQLAALKKVAGQQENAASAQKLVNEGKLPSFKTPILYAIGGNAFLGKVPDYWNTVKKDPKAKHWFFALNGSMMAGAKPTPPAASSTQAQLAAYAYFKRSRSLNYAHEIHVEFRCPAYAGGNDNVIRRAATINDTGSNVQSLRRSDWNALKTATMSPQIAQMLTATGPEPVENVFLEVRIVKPEVTRNSQGQELRTGQYVPLTLWYPELLRIVNDGDTLLSGENMRNYLYFATAPGNETLYVSQRKQAIVDGLPVVQPPKA
ncbi:hypothetical protein LA080_009030 [Diaporthe eres]|uniref:Uncharacterized protein n=1 Tax=Diaporthe vaccinii TaxID=105482 RepID=A0ABR4DYM9_9PEZI|nr:hypothetical protein LA080_009030 [Diaporthe eres]